MPYIGTPPTDRILTSEDIEAGAVEMSDISWKNQPANENISGTIDSFTVKLAEKFTLTGDIAISKDLTLTKLADDGEALVLTTDASSRTIEGSGTISSNTFAQVPNASLTSMTGVLDNTVQDNITRLGTVTSGTIGSGVTIDNTHEGVQHPFNATSWPAFAVGNADADTVTNVDTTWRKVEWNHSSGTNATSGSTSYVADHLFNIGGFFDLGNDWFLPTVAGYYCFSYYTNVHNVGADRRYDVRFYRSADATGDWYDQFFTAGEQTSTSEQTNFGFTTGPVYMNGTTHRVFIMHKIHSGSYGFNKGSHQQGFRGWRVG